MANRDDQLHGEEFLLEDILAEFSSEGQERRRREQEAPGAAVDASEYPGAEPAPVPEEPTQEELVQEESVQEEPVQEAPVQEAPVQPAQSGVPPKKPKKWGLKRKKTPPPPPEKGRKVVDFPEPERPNPVAEGIGQLRRRADEFAEHMYEEEGRERAPSVRRAERYIPGVDEEHAPPVRRQPPKRVRPPAPDIPPADLARRYSKGIKGLRLRAGGVFLLFLAALYLTLAREMGLQLSDQLVQNGAAVCYAMVAVQALALLMSVDGVVGALTAPFQGRMGMDFMIVVSNVAVLIDTLVLADPAGPVGRAPFTAAAVLGLWCMLRGNLKERRGQRLACRTAASASEPYIVTRDEGKWNGRDTYVKWSGPVNGFGSQIQGDNGAQRIFRRVVPVLLVAVTLFAVMASVGRERPGDFLWCLTAILTAATPLSATLCYGGAWYRLSRRLSSLGAALSGWQGVTNTTGGANIVLTDIDLFPVGTVTLNGVKVFGDVSVEKVVSLAATVMRDWDSGLSKAFYNLLRSQGGIYRRGEDFTAYEGGVSEIIRGEQVLVGSASFMVLMDVTLPAGLKVKNAIFCAIDGELAGIFALKYHLPGTVPPALDILIRNKIIPVLATRDCNLIPATLRQRFKLPADRMEYPPVERRRDLSEPEQEHSDTMTAVLCREGVGPYAEAVVGGRRLRTAVRLSAAVACLGGLVGALLAFYLAFVAAYQSLTALHVLIFLVMWLVPTHLISGWVDRY